MQLISFGKPLLTRQIWLVMKLTMILLTAAFLQVSASGNSQTVNFSGKEVSLKKVFTVIENQTNHVFFYDASLLREAKSVTINLKNVSLETALNEIFKDQPFGWVMENKTITIVKKQVTTPNTISFIFNEPLPLITIRGTVKDAEGNGIAGVSVVVKGTRKGTETDANGNFSIQADKGDVLVFSAISYGTKQVKITDASININLDLEISPLDQVIVGGNMALTKRKGDVSSVTVIDSKMLERLPVNTLDQVFNGLVPGIYNSIPDLEGPGGGIMSIRGAASDNSIERIAVYIDGVEYAGGSDYLSQIDKNDIDRIEVVRGPGSATLYGTGSNGGIIQVFTKKGKYNKNTVNITSSAGFYKSKWVDKNPFQQMHSIEAVTGFKKVAYTFGGSYRSIGSYRPDGDEKYKTFYGGVHFNIGKLEANIMGRYVLSNITPSRNPMYDTATHPRTDIIVEPFPGYTLPAYEWFGVVPTKSSNYKRVAQTYFLGTNFTYKANEHWNHSLQAGYTSNDNQALPVTDGVTNLLSQYLGDQYKTSTIRYSNVLSLGSQTDGFAAVITSGIEHKKYFPRAWTLTRRSGSTKQETPANTNFGAFIQAVPSYKNVYLTLALRYEDNKLFNPAYNPRIGLTTNFSTKSLIFKPRISWGKGITSPPYEARIGRLPVGGGRTIIYPNPDIIPQNQKGFDYGLEIYDKKGKYNFEITYYDNVIQDFLSSISLGPDPTDPNLFGYRYINLGKVANKGLELSGQYNISRFSIRGTYSIMNSTIKDTTGGYQSFTLAGKAPGTRMDNLPRHTAGINLTYNFFKIFGKADKAAISFNLTEVDGIISSDFFTYAMDVSYGRAAFVPDTYAYDLTTKSVYRLGFNLDYNFVPSCRFFIQGANITNSYISETGTNYPTYGATWLFGFKYNFTKANN